MEAALVKLLWLKRLHGWIDSDLEGVGFRSVRSLAWILACVGMTWESAVINLAAFDVPVGPGMP